MTSKDSTSLVTFLSAADTSHQVLVTLLYFEIFSFPLTADEIWSYCPKKQSKATIQKTLVQLVKRGILFENQGYYSTQNRPDWIEQRRENMTRAVRYRRRAQWAVAVMRQFPFVRGILISGSLSKGVITDDGDVDYFIVTEPNRLWLCRTLLVVFKKVFLLNSHRYFCVNYFVDTEHLLVEEQNRFTATEIATILPVYNQKLYAAFQRANQWRMNYYPQFPAREDATIRPFQPSWLQRTLEWLLPHSIADRLDKWCMNRTIQLWQRRFKHLASENFAVALKSSQHVSKHHPQDFQNKVKKAYADQLAAFEARTPYHLERKNDLWKKD